MKVKIALVVSVFLLGLIGCEQETHFNHHVNEGNVMIDSIYYVHESGDTILSADLSSTTLVLDKVNKSDEYKVIVKSNVGSLVFEGIKGKYLNANVEIELSSNTFHDYFPEEWEPLRNNSNYATLLMSKNEGHFFFITVDYRSDKEIGHYFEKW